MPGGLIPLVSFGKQNIIVNGNPQITYFYKAFKRHSHFSEENITVPLEGPQELNLDMPIRVRAKIPRYADLARNVSLRVRIPDIYSKFYRDPTSGAYRTPHEFQWVKQLGTQLIQSVAIFVGGRKIQEFAGEWLSIRAQLDYHTDKYHKWQTMTGDVAELNDPARGMYADPAGKYYPNVIPTDNSQQNNRPSIPGRYLLIPLPFWFTEGYGNMLPLKSLEYHEVEVQIIFRPLRSLYTILDPRGNRVRLGYSLAENDVPNSQANYVSYDDPLATPQNFYTDFGFTVPATEYFNLEPTLQIGYVYLSDSDRKYISDNPLQYITTQVQAFQFQGITSRTKFDLDAHNMIRRIVWLGRRSDTIVYRNDNTNCTNWMRADVPPFKRGDGIAIPTSSFPIGSSGTIIARGQRNILRSARILCQGNEIFEEKPAEYFSQQQQFDNIQGAPTGIVGKDQIGPFYVYSFAMNGSDLLQPSGSLNASVINNIQMEIAVEPLPPNASYEYEFTVYVESVNFLEIQSGMGGLRFAL